ncbi:hypothetical protein CAPTEDRAFT_210512 [Capitella teleta]|uniref:Uncharacterized protein n=1 Tax=Capitella teleta TaxID=283909 RepID=R7VKC3_CAPTE|nr:hypothetical protein CAPTEDRAFT_210512 [Capitella teleta]|eukprot:ELU17221.1 hypothetical protein CAPTEDRAFT_210512 [Capitella teleta]
MRETGETGGAYEGARGCHGNSKCIDETSKASSTVHVPVTVQKTYAGVTAETSNHNSASIGNSTSRLIGPENKSRTDEDFTTVQRRNRKKKTAVIGTRTSGEGNLFRGAQGPSRDLFLYRVSKEADSEIIIEYFGRNNVKPRDAIMVSNEEAKFNSFKLQVKSSDVPRILRKDLWQGVVYDIMLRTRANYKRISRQVICSQVLSFDCFVKVV